MGLSAAPKRPSVENGAMLNWRLYDTVYYYISTIGLGWVGLG